MDDTGFIVVMVLATVIIFILGWYRLRIHHQEVIDEYSPLSWK